MSDEMTDRITDYAALLLKLVSAEVRLRDIQAQVAHFELSDDERTEAEKIVNATPQDTKAKLAGRK